MDFPGNDLAAAVHPWDKREAKLWKPLPEEIAVGGGTALFVDGLLPGGKASGRPQLLVGGEPQPLMGWAAAPPRQRGGGDYWWGIARINSRLLGGQAHGILELGLSVGDGPAKIHPLASVAIRDRPEVPPEGRASAAVLDSHCAQPPIAICMATYEPDATLLRRQIDSIREQTHRNWVCLISDDASGVEALRAIEQATAGDPRFVVSAAAENRGFYANFERALSMVPPEAELVALADQDDYWYPDKLEALAAAIGPDSKLAYSDMRIVEESGRTISDTYWSFRRNNYADYGSLVLANTVTGAASMFRRELLDDALPFPPRHAAAFHDHWIAQVAMTLGQISYVDRPLYDYVQHGDASLGYLAANGRGRFSGSLWSRGRIALQRFRRRRYRLGWRVPYFKLYCRTALAAAVLEMRCGDRTTTEQLVLLQTLQKPSSAARWLSGRLARDRWRTTETLSRERVMMAGLSWYALQGAYPRRSRGPGADTIA